MYSHKHWRNNDAALFSLQHITLSKITPLREQMIRFYPLLMYPDHLTA